MTGIIIQARLSSTRLPGKVLKNLSGKPMISHIVERCYITGLPVIVATSEESSDDALCDYLERANIKYFRGSLNNVLERYIKCAEEYGLDDIIRVTGDNPFIDYEAIEKLADFDEYDYVAVVGGALGTGSEKVKLSALKKQLSFNLEDRHFEHVTLFIRENKEKFNCKDIKGYENLKENRLTVDTPEDFKLAEKIYEKYYYNYPITNEEIENFFKKC